MPLFQFLLWLLKFTAQALKETDQGFPRTASTSILEAAEFWSVIPHCR